MVDVCAFNSGDIMASANLDSLSELGGGDAMPRRYVLPLGKVGDEVCKVKSIYRSSGKFRC